MHNKLFQNESKINHRYTCSFTLTHPLTQAHTLTHSHQCHNKSLEDALKRSERESEKQTEVREREKDAQTLELKQLAHQNRGIDK